MYVSNVKIVNDHSVLESIESVLILGIIVCPFLKLQDDYTYLAGGDIWSTTDFSPSDFTPGRYNFTINATDVYGQKGQAVVLIHIPRM